MASYFAFIFAEGYEANRVRILTDDILCELLYALSIPSRPNNATVKTQILLSHQNSEA